MSRIFISHSSANNAAALALSQWLRLEGWDDHFLDIDAQRGLAPGQRWQAALATAVDRCEAVVFLISPAWRDSRWCLAEFHQARSLGKPIFGVLVEATPLASLPQEMTIEWQLCDLVDGAQRREFEVGRPPLVPPARVDFSADGLERLRVGLARAGLDPATFAWPPPGEPDRPPYPGLRALDAQDAAVFFGRDASIVRAIDQLRLLRERGVERLFVVLGASGAGKSSFLRAGLLPRLARDAEHHLLLPPVRPERAAIQGKEGLLAALQQAAERVRLGLSRADLRAGLVSGAALAGLLRRLAAADTVATTPDGRSVVLPIDQAEELFAADGGAESRALLELVAGLDAELRHGDSAGARTGTPLRLLVLITIRADAMESVQREAALSGLAPVLFSLPPMPAAEFKSVIEGPARRHSEAGRRLSIEPALSERLVAEAQGADALPLLALTLEWLFREYAGGARTSIGVAEYERLGGVRGAVEVAVRRALDRPAHPPAIADDPQQQQALLRECFPPLVTLDADSGEPKRRVARLDEFAPAALPLIERLEAQRLLRRDRRPLDGSGESTVVEVAHEALLRQWDAMTRWLADYGDALRTLEALRRAAGEWARRDRDAVWLVHAGHRLDAAEALLDHPQLRARLGEAERDYVAAARRLTADRLREREQQLQAVAEHQQARARLQRRALWGLAAAAAVLIAMGGWVVDRTREVARQTSLVLTDAGERADDDKRFDRGLRLGVLAVRSSWLSPAHPTAAPQLARAAQGSPLVLELVGHQGAVLSARYSPDGQRIVTASEDQTVRLWNAATGAPLGEPMRHEREVDSAAFSADGRRVLMHTRFDGLRVWDAATGKAVAAAPVDLAGGLTSPDGKRLLRLAEDKKSARVVEVETGQAPGDPLQHKDEIVSAAFSPDGRRVLTASNDQSVRISDAQTGRPLVTLQGLARRPEAVGFSTDGRRVIVGAWNGIGLWDAATGKPLGTANVQRGEGVVAVSVSGNRALTRFANQHVALWDVDRLELLREATAYRGDVHFSSDGRRVLRVSDVTIELWDAASGEPIDAQPDAGSRISSASFSPDATLALASSWGRGARLWSAESGLPVGEEFRHDGPVHSAVFSPDGRHVLTASGDRTARVWRVATGRASIAVATDGDHVQFSPDGRHVLLSLQGTVRVLKVEDGLPVGATITPDEPLLAAAFGRDGTQIVTVSAGQARSWDAATGRATGSMPLQDGRGDNNALIGPGAQTAVTWYTWRNQARLWDLRSGKLIGQPLDHGDRIESAEFSADGERLVTSSSDKTARVWNTRSGQPVVPPLQHDDTVFNARLSADGTRLVTKTIDQARVWDVGSGQPVGPPIAGGRGPVAVAIDHGGHRIALSYDEGPARIWDVDRGVPVGEALLTWGHVFGLEFDTTGKRLVTASTDGSVLLWDAATAKPLSEPLRHGGPSRSPTFSPDRRHLLAFDGQARIWDVRWSAAAHAPDLAAQVCATALLGAARRLTLADIAAAPILAGRVGEDVCTGEKAPGPSR